MATDGDQIEPKQMTCWRVVKLYPYINHKIISLQAIKSLNIHVFSFLLSLTQCITVAQCFFVKRTLRGPVMF